MARASDVETSTWPGVTIVVPVYADLPAVEACLISVLEHADETWARLLVVNDCGPDADAIERRILELLGERPRTQYVRNPENLGFVRTCNRAAFELDDTDNDILLLNSDAVLTPGAVAELRAVLNISERHGAVAARSNDATIATIPVFHRERHVGVERARRVFDAISPHLPRYYTAPVAPGFCFLARRRLIRNHGLFDEIYGHGYNEENDFCLRINDVGYSSLIANRALVFHAASSSFGEERRAQLDAVNSRHLIERYPFYPSIVARFVRDGYPALDRFADLIVPRPDAPRRVLLDLHHLSKHYDGTTKNALSVIEHLVADPPEDIEISIAAYPETTDFFRLRDYGFPVVDYSAIDSVYDLGVAIVPVTSVGQLATLHRACARIVVPFLDVIALRTYRHAAQTPMKPVVVEHSLRWADRVLAISTGGLDDLDDLIPGRLGDYRAHTEVITQGSGLDVGTDHASLTGQSRMDPATREQVDAGGYVLVVGNGFAHKQVVPTLLALEGSGRPVVAMADRLIGDRFPDVRIALSGTLTESEIDELYGSAAIVVCPSAYEGFGLSIAEAAQHGRPVVVYDTDVAREVIERLGIDGVTMFRTFDELVPTLDAVLARGDVGSATAMRSLRDFAREFWTAAVATLDAPLDVERLRARDEAIAPLTIVAETSLATAERLLLENTDILASTSFRLARRIARLAGVARRVARAPRSVRARVIERASIDQT